MNPRAWLREPRGFDIVKTTPFLPNTAYAFSVLNTFTLKSWHGRTAIPGHCGERNSLLNIWYENAEFANGDLIAEQIAAKTALVFKQPETGTVKAKHEVAIVQVIEKKC